VYKRHEQQQQNVSAAGVALELDASSRLNSLRSAAADINAP